MKSKCVDCRQEALVGLQKKEKFSYDKVETVRAGNWEQNSFLDFARKLNDFLNYRLTNVKLVTRMAILKVIKGYLN